MSEAEARFSVLRQSADASAVAAIERLDYFGQTVNIAARVQSLALSHSIFATEPVVENPLSARLLGEHGLTPVSRRHSLRGIANELTVYEIP